MEGGEAGCVGYGIAVEEGGEDYLQAGGGRGGVAAIDVGSCRDLGLGGGGEGSGRRAGDGIERSIRQGRDLLTGMNFCSGDEGGGVGRVVKIGGEVERGGDVRSDV